ncbi:MAG: ferrochelatase, partial [Alcanivoracaceae bacterium]|nr:ferrochelatase [Alcanivoracaceae bacterium]
MQYQGASQFRHDQPGRVGLLITNLGTPDAPTTPALRRYLAEFLSDPRVVEVPRLLWMLILHGIILRIRPRRSAHAYQSVWTEAGSPLMLHTLAQRDALRTALKPQWGDDLVVECAMRYGNPSIASMLEGMQQQGVRQLLVLPLYPQYSAATSASTFDALAADFSRRRWLPDLRFISHYHDFPAYIEALAESIEEHWQKHGQPDKLVLSYHGVPQRYLDNGDPYHCECHKTSRLLAERLGLQKDQYITTFQSRFGREEWLKPYTDETLKALPDQGVKHVQVVCP